MEKVEKSSKGYQKSLLGVVSTNPGALLDGTNFLAGGTASATNNPMRPAVALVGRVPVKVTMENGPIVPGDYITSSATTAGYAMKATRSGQVIGQAIESFDGSNPAKQTVVIYIKPGYQFINNTFVLEDGEQLANTNNPTPPEQVGTLVINQKGSGSILQVQKESTDRLLLTNEGTFLLSASASTGNVFEIKNNDTSLLSIAHTGTITAQGTILVKKDLVVLGRILGSTAIIAKNTSTQDIHQGDVLMLTGAVDVPTLGEQPTITVAPAVSGDNVVLVGIADKNLSDFNIDPSISSSDPTVVKPGEFLSVVITGTYKQVAVTGTIALGDKLTASAIAGKAQKLEATVTGQLIGVSLDLVPNANGMVRVMLMGGFQNVSATTQIVSQSPPAPEPTPTENPTPPTEENQPNPEA